MAFASPRPGVKAPWSSLWRTESNKVFQDVFDGKMTTKDGVDRSVQIWNQMRDDFIKMNPSYAKK